MTIVVMLVIGLVIGVIARLLMPGRESGGLVVTRLLIPWPVTSAR
jgi:uncharacterized membrane protein YeaQ/YmgE (transglycosylase-associated protein family)